MTDNIEQAGAAVDTAAAEVKAEVPTVESHLAKFEGWTVAEYEKAKAWIDAELAKL